MSRSEGRCYAKDLDRLHVLLVIPKGPLGDAGASLSRGPAVISTVVLGGVAGGESRAPAEAP
jgi:hypothetical protein